LKNIIKPKEENEDEYSKKVEQLVKKIMDRTLI